MAKIYSTANDIHFIRSQLKELIEKRSIDSFKTHCAQIFLFKNDEKVVGEMHDVHFKLWLCSRNLTGAFYAIVSGNILVNKNKVILKINSKMNIVGLLISLVIASPIFYLVCTEYLFLYKPDFGEALRRVFFSCILVALFMSVPIYSYVRTRNAIIGELKDKLQLHN